MENTQHNLSASNLKATSDNIEDKEFADMQEEMQADLNAKAMGLMLEPLLKSPMLSNALNQGMTFLPMIVKKGEKYLGRDKFRIMVYIDAETGTFVVEKVTTANIDLTYKSEPNPADFFFIEKKDLDNPKEFLTKMKSKLNINIF